MYRYVYVKFSVIIFFNSCFFIKVHYHYFFKLILSVEIYICTLCKIISTIKKIERVLPLLKAPVEKAMKAGWFLSNGALTILFNVDFKLKNITACLCAKIVKQ